MVSRRRLLYLATSSGIGGAERQVRDLSVRMRDNGWDVLAVSMLPLERGFADLPAQGVTTASLRMGKGVPDPRGLRRLLAILRDWRPDVLHAHMIHANLLARTSRLLHRTPVLVCTMHSQRQGSRARMVAYRITDHLSDATTAVSSVAREDAISLGAVSASRVTVVPNGIDVSQYGRDRSTRSRLRSELGLGDDFTYLAVGRIAVPKDYPNLISAFARTHGAHDRARLLIAGTGPQDDLRDRVDRAGLGGHVRLLGERQDVPELMKAADAYVMSSAWEGLPLVLLEAAASYLPIVATDVGGNGEVVIDGVTGVIVPPRDPEALAIGMTKLMTIGDGRRESMGRAGRELVERAFDIEIVVQRWISIYQSLLERRQGR